MGLPGEVENIWVRKKFVGGKVQLKENIWGTRTAGEGKHLGEGNIWGGKI